MPPLAIAAGVGAIGSIAGGVLSASAQKKAAGKAADTSLQVAEQNNALQKQIYGENKDLLNPYVTRGNEAGSAINALLGISGTSSAAAPTGWTPGTPGGSGVPQVNPGYGGGAAQPVNGYGTRFGVTPALQNGGSSAFLARHPQFVNGGSGPDPVGAPQAVAPPPAPAGPPGQTPYQNAFQNYLNSTGYQFQVDQGNKGINQGYAAKGALQSGAALKALQTYGQNTATGFFKDYLGLLGNQQGVGLSGASAVAGVGQNYANSVGANNTNAGNAAANAYLAQGNANANLYGNIAGAIGGVANAFGSSYRPGG